VIDDVPEGVATDHGLPVLRFALLDAGSEHLQGGAVLMDERFADEVDHARLR
jgi:hypothetical protein